MEGHYLLLILGGFESIHVGWHVSPLFGTKGRFKEAKETKSPEGDKGDKDGRKM